MKIKDLPDYTKPSSKLLKKGASSLDTPELLAIILGIGKLGESAIELSSRLLKKYDLDKFEELGFRELVKEINGDNKKDSYSIVKAMQILSLIELSKRYNKLRNKGYSSRDNMEVASKLGAIPYIVFKKNASKKPRGSFAWCRMKKYFDERNEDFMEHYHKRSNAETVFHMIKRKFGAHLNSKSEMGQINEVFCKALSHNICVLIQEMFEIGINPEFIKCAKMEVVRCEA